MSEQILSQDEVDALLQGITGDADSPAQEPAEPGAVRSHDLASQDRIVRSRMPMLEVINERFARNIRSGVFELIRKSPAVTIGAVKVLSTPPFCASWSCRRTSTSWPCGRCAAAG